MTTWNPDAIFWLNPPFDSLEKSGFTLKRKRTNLEGGGKNTEVIIWNQDGKIKTTKRILYVPGLPGDTLNEFCTFVENPENIRRFFCDFEIDENRNKKPVGQTEIVGVLHSGIFNNTDNRKLLIDPEESLLNIVNEQRLDSLGITADDWIEDVKIVLIESINKNIPIKVISHS